MIDQLIAYCVRNKIIVFAGVLALVAWGVISITKLPIDAVPDITDNQVQVITTSQSLAAQEIEQFITYPLEIALSTVPDVEEVRSISRFGLSVITVVFKEEVDILEARQLVSERLVVAKENIPKDVGTPELGPISTGLGEIYQYIIKPDSGYEDQYTPMELRTIQDWIIKRQLLGTPGVAEVSSFGGFMKEYEVAINPRKLRNFNLTIPDIFLALESNNENTGSAYIDKGTDAFFIRGIGLVKTLKDIEKIRIKTFEGVPIYIRDVAKVQYGSAVRYGAMTDSYKGEAVGGIVLMLKGANSHEVINNVKERMESIKQALPKGLNIDVFLDRSDLIDRAIKTVSKNLIEGGIIVVFVLVLLLGNLRAGLVVASVIPLSLLFAIAMMRVFGISGNLMSLGAIDFGLIVDGAVIIVEAIVHRISKTPSDKLKTRHDFNEEVIAASARIRKSAAFGELIIMIVYIPILSLSGVEGKMFKPMAMTVSFAILGALILSMTYVPAMSSLILKRKENKLNISDKIMSAIGKWYHKAIRKVLNHKKLVSFSALGLFLVSAFVFTRLGGEFIPTLEEGDFAIEVRLMPGSSLHQTIETNMKASEILEKNFPEVKRTIGKIGTAEIPTDPMPIEACDLMAILKPKDEWTSADTKDELVEKMSEKLEVIPGVEFGFMQPIQMRFNELMTGAKQDIVIKIFGEDLDILATKAQKTGELIQNVEGVGDIYVEQTQGLPQIMVEYRREKLAQYGVDVSTVNMVLKSAVAGQKAGLVYEDQKRFDLTIRLQEEFRENIDDLRSLYVPLEGGAQIPLSELAIVTFQEGPAQISREKAQRKVIIGLNVRNRDIKSVVDEVSEILKAELNLPSGYFIEYGGQFENLEKGQKRLIMVVPVALLFIAILLYLTFGSLKQTLLIFTAIPFAAVGGIFSLLFRGMPFSISAGVGFIALSGVAVLNGIVLISMFNHLKDEGMKDLKERVLEGTKERLRPVLMTAMVASLGFFPMALSTSAGAEVQKPLATVVIGGLITSTILTLFVLPVLYIYTEKIKFSLSGKTAVLLLLCLALPAIPKAQDTTSQVMVSPEQAISIALENNPIVKESELNYQRLKALEKTSINLPETNLSFSYGRFNSFEYDNSFSVSQEFASPMLYSARKNLLEAYTEKGNIGKEISTLDLRMLVHQSYFQALVAGEKVKILTDLDSLYEYFDVASALKYEVGETNYLEAVQAKTKKYEIQNLLFQAKADYDISINKLKILMKYEEDITLKSDSLIFIVPILDTSKYINQPILKIADQEIKVAEAHKSVSGKSLLPKITVGFNSQTLKGYYETNGPGSAERYVGGDTRFNYISAGVAFPLWFKDKLAKIEAAKIEINQAESHREKVLLQLREQLVSTYNNYLKYKNTYLFYLENALPQAYLLSDLGIKSYKEGESGYLELIETLRESGNIKLRYIDIIEKLNYYSIHMDYLLGGNIK